jgi:hypothetical protein
MVDHYDVASEDNLLTAADTLFSITDFFGQLVLVRGTTAGRWSQSLILLIDLSLLAYLGEKILSHRDSPSNVFDLYWSVLTFLHPSTHLTTMHPASAMAGVGIVAKIAHDSISPPASIIPLGDVAFALPLGVNFLLTALIAGRIWYITRSVNSWKHRNAIRIAMEVIVESGALILASQLIFVVLWGIQSNAQNIAVSATLQIYVGTSLCSPFNFISLSFLGYRPYSDHRARGDGPFDRDDNGREVRCK